MGWTCSQGSVATIEAAFHVTMGVYQHPTKTATFYAPDREPTVDLPFRFGTSPGLDNYSIPHPDSCSRPLRCEAPMPLQAPVLEHSFCGSDMRAAYYGGTALTGTGQNIGLLEYSGYDIADVNTYYTNAKQRGPLPSTAFPRMEPTELPQLEGCDDTEQILDITQALGMAPGTTVYVYVGSSDTAILGSMSSHNPLPLQLSTSWTWAPSDPSTDDRTSRGWRHRARASFKAAGDSGSWVQTTVWRISGGRCECHYCRRHGLNDQGQERALGLGNCLEGRRRRYSPPDGIPIPSWQQLPGVITGGQPGIHNIGTARTSRQTRISTFTSVPTKPPVLQTNMAGPVLRRRCGPATWLWPINRRRPKAAARLHQSDHLSDGSVATYDSDFHDITSGSNG